MIGRPGRMHTVVGIALVLWLSGTGQGAGEEVAAYPSGRIPDLAELRHVLTVQDPGDPAWQVRTVIFAGRLHEIPDGLFVSRSGIRLKGRPGAVLRSDSASVFLVRGVVGLTLENLTLRTAASEAGAVVLSAISGAGEKSFVRDVVLDRCRLEAPVGVAATAGVRELSVIRCRFTVTEAGGCGVSWGDGGGLFVTRSRFRTGSGVQARSALEVRGPADPGSEGGSSRRVILSRNRVSGDFAMGFDLSDVADLVVCRNRFSFPGPLGSAASGRVGIGVHRVTGSTPIDAIDVVRNRVDRAHTGLWLVDIDHAVIEGNRFRRCAAPTADVVFGDAGCAVRVVLPVTGSSDVRILRNNFRGLRSPQTDPAVRILPESCAVSCFGPDDRNRVESWRPLHPLDGR